MGPVPLAAIRAPLLRALAACICAGFLALPAHAADPAPPSMLRKTVPVYPVEARRLGQEGTVHIRIRVLADGQPADLRVQRSSGTQALDNAALAAATASTFRPARNAEGAAVEAVVVVPYKFVLEDGPEREPARPPLPAPAPEAP